MGRIADHAKSMMPVSWAAMSNDDRIGDASLLAQIDSAEAQIFGDTLSELSIDEDALPFLVVDFSAKVAMLELIRTAIDFWMDQKTSATTTGTAETTTYADRIAALKEQRAELLVDLARMEDIVTPLIPALETRRSTGVPLLSTIDDELLTPNPQDLGRPYALPQT